MFDAVFDRALPDWGVLGNAAYHGGVDLDVYDTLTDGIDYAVRPTPDGQWALSRRLDVGAWQPVAVLADPDEARLLAAWLTTLARLACAAATSPAPPFDPSPW